MHSNQSLLIIGLPMAHETHQVKSDLCHWLSETVAFVARVYWTLAWCYSVDTEDYTLYNVYMCDRVEEMFSTYDSILVKSYQCINKTVIAKLIHNFRNNLLNELHLKLR